MATFILLSSLFYTEPAVADGCPKPSFAAIATFGAGTNPVSVTVGDFNGDGKPDLVVANNASTNVSVLLGTGDGTFQAAVNYRTATRPSSVAVGDFNSDSKPDLAVANDGSGNISVLLGKGDGSFGVAVNYGVGSRPVSVAVGDFNNDAKLDLVVVNSTVSGTVSVLLGNGDGTFQAAVKYATGKSPFFVAVGDFNGDGKPDLAVANHGDANSTNPGNVSVLLGNGDGTFQAAMNYAAGTGPRCVVTGDLNGDARLDLIVANGVVASGSPTIAVLLGNGDGTFQAAVNAYRGGGAQSVAVIDLNGDAKPDLAVSNGSVLLGNGNGTFQEPSFQRGTIHGVQGFVAAGDLNGDGKPDLAVATAEGVNVLLGKGNGTFLVAVNYAAGRDPEAVVAGDFNGDGKPDLAVSNGIVLSGKGDGTFQDGVYFGAGLGPQPRSVQVGNLNGDGQPDLVVANAGSPGLGSVAVMLGQSQGKFPTIVKYAAGNHPYSVAVGDFNSDGKLDLAVANVGSGTADLGNLSVLLGKGDGTFQRAVNYGAGSNPNSVAMADFNDDAKLDLVVANRNSGNVSVLLGDGAGTFSAAVNYGAGASPRFVAVGDFNGDGKADLAVANANSDNISILLGNGDGTFQAAVNYATGPAPNSVAVADFNGDGKADLAVANSGRPSSAIAGFVSVLLGNGDGTFQTAVNYIASEPHSVGVGDFNRDDKPDLAVANYSSVEVSILINTCVSAGVGLGITRSGTAVTISWPSPSTGFVLESTPSLSPPDWKKADEVATPNNGRLEVTVSADQSSRYFRLHKQP
ncbi:MAG: VCBS repeat-containing protein [Verrucomicrobia bacterium]|nr:VCBS repeat-containing protein [Verrucomicrobiota bacterium]